MRRLIVAALRPLQRLFKSLVIVFGILLLLGSWKMKDGTIEKSPPLRYEATTSAFRPGAPKFLIVVGYQRVLSTFIGQILNQNPRAFNLFEPVDGMYVDMYGTSHGWNVPTDLAFYPNGSQRVVPEWEKDYISEKLDPIFTCNFSAASMGMLTSHFFGLYGSSQSKAKSFIKCISQWKIWHGYPRCRTHIKPYCRSRFVESTDIQKCHREITRAEKLSSINLNTTKTKLSTKEKDFIRFVQCRTNFTKLAHEKCLPLLENACRNSTLRVTKTVRLSMELALRKLTSHDNFRIVHLIRDPKAVTLSRRGHSSFRGAHSTIVSEARMYCETLVKDLKMIEEIPVKYKSRIMRIFTDSFSKNNTKGVHDVYEFLGENVPGEVIGWVKENERTPSSNDTFVYHPKWHENLTYKEVYAIDEACYGLYKMLRPPWKSAYSPDDGP